MMPKPIEGHERRGAPRYTADGKLPGVLKIDLRTEVLSLSAGGMLVEIELPLAQGSEHRFSLTLDGKELELTGVVRNCNPLLNGQEPPNYRVGVEFVQLNADELLVLNQFVERRAGV